MGIFEKFKLGFKKSATSFTSGLRHIITKKEIDDKTLDEIENYLIKSDVGLQAASEIKNIIAQEKIDPCLRIISYSLNSFYFSNLRPVVVITIPITI